MLSSKQNQPGTSVNNPEGNRARVDEGGPITLLNSESSGITVLDEPPPGAVSEIDTLAQGSGDSDTI